ncbi:hypothetical protein B0H13DRAFT_1857310 [Mycena leptocephala]|nr:hypothetical protein B0H13DRAFT_1857310 [Mycena leptocephala]
MISSRAFRTQIHTFDPKPPCLFFLSFSIASEAKSPISPDIPASLQFCPSHASFIPLLPAVSNTSKEYSLLKCSLNPKVSIVSLPLYRPAISVAALFIHTGGMVCLVCEICGSTGTFPPHLFDEFVARTGITAWDIVKLANLKEALRTYVLEKIANSGEGDPALPAKDRDRILKAWWDWTEFFFFVTTNVLGSGLDCHKVTHVINYRVPYTMFDLEQQNNRAGRDDKLAIVRMLVLQEEAPFSDRTDRIPLEQMNLLAHAEECRRIYISLYFDGRATTCITRHGVLCDYFHNQAQPPPPVPRPMPAVPLARARVGQTARGSHSVQYRRADTGRDQGAKEHGAGRRIANPNPLNLLQQRDALGKLVTTEELRPFAGFQRRGTGRERLGFSPHYQVYAAGVVCFQGSRCSLGFRGQ